MESYEEKEEQVKNVETCAEQKTKEKVKKKNKKLKIILISSIVFIILVMILSVIFALININNKNIINGVKINEIDIGGLSKEQAIEKVKNETANKLKINIPIKYGEYEEIVSPNDINANFNIVEMVDVAYNVGRDSNIFVNNFQIVKAMLFKTNIETNTIYDNELLEKKLKDISVKIPNAVQEVTYSIENDKLIITRGKEGLQIKDNEFIEYIINAIKNSNTKTIIIPVENKKPDPINIDKIYEEVHVEAKDAYYTSNPFEIFPHVNGVNFDKEAARELLKEDKEEYEIQLQITVPSVTTDKIGTEAFPDLLSTFTTKYDVGNVNRSTNLVLATNKINGTVLMPGEEFSYNKVVGKRTVAAGYKQAHIFQAGRVIDGLGGGICQISTTLYNAALYANLEITDRSNHQFPAGYVGLGKDATVAYGAIDFKFKNNRNYPIKIVGNTKNGIAKMSIYGVKESVEYEVEISTTVLKSFGYTTIYEDDPTMEVGKEKVVQSGGTGYKTVTYKILKLNGNTVSKTEINRDTYDAMKKIIARGTKQTQAPAPAPTTPVTPTAPETPVTPTPPVTPTTPPTTPVTPTTPTTPTEPVTPTTPPAPPTTPSNEV